MSGEGMLPYLYDEEYSVLILGDTTSPGKFTILSGAGRPKNWDIQAPKGSTGASTVLNGDKPRLIKTRFDLSSQEDFDRWESFARLINSMTEGPKPFALPVYHPDFARSGVTEVTNGGIGDAVHDGRGGVSHSVDFLEYRPAKPKVAAKPTAKGAGKVAGAAATKPDPNAKAKAELAALVAAAKAS